MLRDIGANLTHARFEGDLDDVLLRARRAGVGFVDVTGVDLPSSQAALELALAHPGFLGASAGIHPHAAQSLDAPALDALRKMLAHPHTLMCGEMGLDYARDLCPRDIQRRAFEAQLDLAQECSKPLFLHCRDAFEDFVAILDRRPQLWSRCIVHCFTDGPDQARAFLERGAFLGVTGWIADKRRNGALLAAAKLIPLDRALLETDAPYLTPINRPKTQTRDRNEPSLLPWVAQALAQAMGVSAAELIQASWDNAERLIGRSAPRADFTAPSGETAPLAISPR